MIPIYLSKNPNNIVYIKEFNIDDMSKLEQKHFKGFLTKQIALGNVYNSLGEQIFNLPTL